MAVCPHCGGGQPPASVARAPRLPSEKQGRVVLDLPPGYYSESRLRPPVRCYVDVLARRAGYALARWTSFAGVPVEIDPSLATSRISMSWIAELYGTTRTLTPSIPRVGHFEFLVRLAPTTDRIDAELVVRPDPGAVWRSADEPWMVLGADLLRGMIVLQDRNHTYFFQAAVGA